MSQLHQSGGLTSALAAWRLQTPQRAMPVTQVVTMYVVISEGLTYV